ncbi:MAG: PAS domain S-box protein [Candidatus Binataceae bacterium]
MVTSGIAVIVWLTFMAGGAWFLFSRYRRASDALDASRHQLEQINATLEERVRERSAVLAEQKGLLESILNSMSDAIVMVDKDLKPVLMNPAARRELRADVRRPADWLADYDVFAPDSTAPLATNQPFVARGLTGDVIEGFELRVRNRESGRERWIDASVRPVMGADGAIGGALLVIRDITGRHDVQIERALFASVANSVPDAVMSLTPDGIITSWNPGAERLFGYTGEEIIGKSDECMVPPELRPELREIARLLDAGKSIENLETRRVRKDGSTVEILLSASGIRTFPGRLEGYALTARDNTERKRLHQEMQRARDLAIEAAQTRADFLAKMSHEIRTPLNAIVGMAELLQLTDLNKEQRERAAIIESSSRLLMAIVNDVLDFTKLSAGRVVLEKIAFDLRDLARTTADSFEEAAARKGIALALRLDPALPKRVNGDPNRLRQILNNLISNAIKFTSEGEVVISVEPAGQTASDELIRFQIADSGIGIAPEVQKRLFEPFVQAESSTARRYGGSGLGLVISPQLARQMGGEIQLHSELGKGAVFHFTARFEKTRADERIDEELSVSESRGAESDAAAIPEATSSYQNQRGMVSADHSRSNFRILVVEDNPINRELAAEQLRVLGYAGDIVDEAQAALDALARRDYDLVLMDCEMPVMDGYEATREIRRREGGRRRTTIIAMTAHATREQHQRCLDAGMDGFLSKPVRLRTLSATLESWSAESAYPVNGIRPAGADESVRAVSESDGVAIMDEDLDPATLAEIAELSEASGDDVLRRLVEAFLSELPKRISALRSALEANDLAALGRAAHALRSAAGIGATGYANLCAEVESRARRDDRAEAVSLAQVLIRESDRVSGLLMRAAGMI